MRLDPKSVRVEDLERTGPHDRYAQIVGRYARAVVVEVDLPGRDPSYTVYALADFDTGGYDQPHAFPGLSRHGAHQMARNWTRLG